MLQLFQCFLQQEATNCSKFVREQLYLKYEIAILEKNTNPTCKIKKKKEAKIF